LGERMKYSVGLSLQFVAIIFMLGLPACMEDPEDPFVTVTEEILYISGERVIVVGRILSLGNANIEDHGFQISTSENFSSPIIISLGSREKPGRFVGENANLRLNTTYFCRSFIALQDETLVGNTLVFKTLAADIVDFNPKIGSAGEKLIITGKNFTDNTEVYFGNIRAQVTELLFESQLTVTIPQFSDNFQVEINVKTQDQVLTFNKPFEYVTGKWSKVGDFINNQQLIETIFLKRGDELLFGLGRVGNNINSNIWSLDLNTFAWSQTNYSGGGLAGAFFTSGYFGAGINVFSSFGTQLSNQLWSYNNGEFIQMPNLPFQLYKSIAFTIGGNLYVAGGTPNLRDYTNVILKYNIGNNTWQQVSISPVFLQVENPTFTYGDSQFFIVPDGSVLKYTPSSNTWQNVGRYPLSNFGIDGIAVVIGDKAYIGLNSDVRLFEFDLITYEWKRKNPILSGSGQRNAAYFSHENELFVLRRYTSPPINPLPSISLWKFEPDNW
jgi:hypothetical protein